MPRPGVLLVGFGGPDCPEAVGGFMCNLMGREPSPELVARVRSRYEEIGGSSPLLDIAQDLADGVAVSLAAQGTPMPVEIGMRYWQPLIADGVSSLVRQGVGRIVMVSLSPFEAAVTHGEYRSAVDLAVAEHPGVDVVEAPLLSRLAAFTDLHVSFAREAIAAAATPSALVAFSAHSLPLSDAAMDDSYVRGLQLAAETVASRLGLASGSQTEVLPGITAFGSGEDGRAWLLAYQSQGARGGEWLGPDLDEVIAAAARHGHGAVVVVPIGFATDHMETRYDLDIVARRAAQQAGVSFVRSALPNAHPALAADVARAVKDAAEQA